MLRVGFAVLLGVSTPALALDCKSASDQTSLNQCADDAFRAADEQLNALYGQVEARLANAAAPDAKAQLAEAERDWVAFRDAECRFRSSDSDGGSMHPMAVLGCRTDLTLKRVADLKRDLSCKAGDGDCPAAAP